MKTSFFKKGLLRALFFRVTYICQFYVGIECLYLFSFSLYYIFEVQGKVEIIKYSFDHCVTLVYRFFYLIDLQLLPL